MVRWSLQCRLARATRARLLPTPHSAMSTVSWDSTMEGVFTIWALSGSSNAWRIPVILDARAWHSGASKGPVHLVGGMLDKEAQWGGCRRPGPSGSIPWAMRSRSRFRGRGTLACLAAPPAAPLAMPMCSRLGTGVFPRLGDSGTQHDTPG